MSQNKKIHWTVKIGALAGLFTALAGLIVAIDQLFPDLGSILLEKINISKASEPTTWNGVFQQFEEDTDNPENFKSVVNSEEMELIFSRTKVTGTVKATGTDVNTQKVWEQSGYRKGDFLVLSYQRTDESVPGIGTYFLERQGGDSDTYIGYWEGLDCDVKSIVHCPYVLSQGNVKDIKKDFKKHLQTPCEKINSSSNFSSCT
jgi:hypothetical protein